MEEGNKNFKTEQEERDAEMMEFVRKAVSAFEEKDRLPQKTVEYKVKLVKALADELKKYYGDQAEIEYMLHEPYKNDAIITMRCKEFCVKNVRQFVALASLGNDIHIDPYTDGTIGIHIGINGLTEFINDEEKM